MRLRRPILPVLVCLLCLLCLTGCFCRQQAAGRALPPDKAASRLHSFSGRVMSAEGAFFLLQDEAGQVRAFPQQAGTTPGPADLVSLSYRVRHGQTRVEALAVRPASLTEQAQWLLAAMSAEEKVGQVILARCPEENGVYWLETLHLGGYILFDRDVRDRSPEQLQAEIASYQAASRLPLFIAADEEGGAVVRLSRYPALRDSPFLSPQRLFANGGWEAVRRDTLDKCAFLREMGVNLNLAPLADVSTDPGDFIYNRSFGQGATETAKYVALVVGTMAEQQMGSTLKHFPGYGNNRDTHTGAALDLRPYSQFQTADFLPFQAGIEAGATLVMVSHNTVTCLDPELPASLSPAVLTALREELGFDGVAITDDLAMTAATGTFNGRPGAVQALLAGEDMLCSSDFYTQYQQVLGAVKSGALPMSRLDQAVERVLRAKLQLGILQL